MRIRVLFEVEGDDKVVFRRDYRRNFMSFLKSVFSQEGLLDDYENYSEKRFRQYTFSVWFGKNFGFGEEIHAEKKLSLLFSSGDPLIITSFYNGVLQLKSRSNSVVQIGGNSFKINSLELLPYKSIKSNKVVFKTLGVCILNDPTASPKDFKKWYIIPTDDIERFNKCLSDFVSKKYSFIKKKEAQIKIKMNILDEKAIKETIVKHYNGNLRGFRGYFELEGDPEILQFIYDYGFGIRTGQGFGLLEIVDRL